MPIKTVNGKERFVVENDERKDEDNERKIVDDARNYFDSANLLLNVGLRRKIEHRYCPSTFHKIRMGDTSVSIESWEIIRNYAERYRRGERYSSN
jgi:hypothetical protein